MQATGWAPTHPVVHPMDYSGYSGPHPPPFTSPPATPMTPMTPMTPHHAFTVPVPQYDIPAHGYPKLVRTMNIIILSVSVFHY